MLWIMDEREAPKQLMVRGIDPVLWRQLRATSVLRRQTLGELLNEILRDWFARNAAHAKD